MAVLSNMYHGAILISVATILVLLIVRFYHSRPRTSTKTKRRMQAPGFSPRLDPPVYTRGPPRPFRQVGVMYSSADNSKQVFPLYGRPTSRNAYRWNYHTFLTSDNNHSPLKLQVYDQNGTDCSRHDGRGCAEVQDGSILRVRPYGEVSVDLYHE